MQSLYIPPSRRGKRKHVLFDVKNQVVGSMLHLLTVYVCVCGVLIMLQSDRVVGSQFQVSFGG